MRRHALKAIFGTSVALLTSGALGATEKRLVDKRLLGTWRSDKERTIALWKYQKELTQGHSIFQRRLRFFHEIAEDLLVYLSPGIVEKTFDFPDKKIDIFQKLPAGESLSRKGS